MVERKSPKDRIKPSEQIPDAPATAKELEATRLKLERDLVEVEMTIKNFNKVADFSVITDKDIRTIRVLSNKLAKRQDISKPESNALLQIRKNLADITSNLDKNGKAIEVEVHGIISNYKDIIENTSLSNNIRTDAVRETAAILKSFGHKTDDLGLDDMKKTQDALEKSIAKLKADNAKTSYGKLRDESDLAVRSKKEIDRLNDHKVGQSNFQEVFGRDPSSVSRGDIGKGIGQLGMASLGLGSLDEQFDLTGKAINLARFGARGLDPKFQVGHRSLSIFGKQLIGKKNSDVSRYTEAPEQLSQEQLDALNGTKPVSPTDAPANPSSPESQPSTPKTPKPVKAPNDSSTPKSEPVASGPTSHHHDNSTHVDNSQTHHHNTQTTDEQNLVVNELKKQLNVTNEKLDELIKLGKHEHKQKSDDRQEKQNDKRRNNAKPASSNPNDPNFAPSGRVYQGPESQRSIKDRVRKVMDAASGKNSATSKAGLIQKVSGTLLRGSRGGSGGDSSNDGGSWWDSIKDMALGAGARSLIPAAIAAAPAAAVVGGAAALGGVAYLKAQRYGSKSDEVSAKNKDLTGQLRATDDEIKKARSSGDTGKLTDLRKKRGEIVEALKSNQNDQQSLTDEMVDAGAPSPFAAEKTGFDDRNKDHLKSQIDDQLDQLMELKKDPVKNKKELQRIIKARNANIQKLQDLGEKSPDAIPEATKDDKQSSVTSPDVSPTSFASTSQPKIDPTASIGPNSVTALPPTIPPSVGTALMAVESSSDSIPPASMAPIPGIDNLRASTPQTITIPSDKVGDPEYYKTLPPEQQEAIAKARSGILGAMRNSFQNSGQTYTEPTGSRSESTEIRRTNPDGSVTTLSGSSSSGTPRTPEISTATIPISSSENVSNNPRSFVKIGQAEPSLSNGVNAPTPNASATTTSGFNNVTNLNAFNGTPKDVESAARTRYVTQPVEVQQHVNAFDQANPLPNQPERTYVQKLELAKQITTGTINNSSTGSSSIASDDADPLTEMETSIKNTEKARIRYRDLVNSGSVKPLPGFEAPKATITGTGPNLLAQAASEVSPQDVQASSPRSANVDTSSNENVTNSSPPSSIDEDADVQDEPSVHQRISEINENLDELSSEPIKHAAKIKALLRRKRKLQAKVQAKTVRASAPLNAGSSRFGSSISSIPQGLTSSSSGGVPGQVSRSENIQAGIQSGLEAQSSPGGAATQPGYSSPSQSQAGNAGIAEKSGSRRSSGTEGATNSSSTSSPGSMGPDVPKGATPATSGVWASDNVKTQGPGQTVGTQGPTEVPTQAAPDNSPALPSVPLQPTAPQNPSTTAVNGSDGVPTAPVQSGLPGVSGATTVPNISDVPTLSTGNNAPTLSSGSQPIVNSGIAASSVTAYAPAMPSPVVPTNASANVARNSAPSSMEPSFGGAIASGSGTVVPIQTNTGSGTSTGAVGTGGQMGGALGNTIAKGEGGYGSFNRGIAGDARGAKMDFGNMTVGQIMQQQSLPMGDPNRLFAVGKYQVIPKTMEGAIKSGAVSKDDKFTPEVQEKVGRDYLMGDKRPEVRDYITGQSDNLTKAQKGMAYEFASVGAPEGTTYNGKMIAPGASVYGGSAGNKASTSPEKIAEALNADRATYQQILKDNPGISSKEAYSRLSAVKSTTDSSTANASSDAVPYGPQQPQAVNTASDAKFPSQASGNQNSAPGVDPSLPGTTPIASSATPSPASTDGTTSTQTTSASFATSPTAFSGNSATTTAPAYAGAGASSRDAMYAQAKTVSSAYGESNINPTYKENTFKGESLKGACVRGTSGVISALTGDNKFRLNGGNADSYTGANSYLQKSGMYGDSQTLPTKGYEPRIGDVVAATGGGRGMGHIQVYDGKQWVSDGRQPNGILQNHYGNFTLHRLNENGLSKLNPDYVKENDSKGTTQAALSSAGVTPQGKSDGWNPDGGSSPTGAGAKPVSAEDAGMTLPKPQDANSAASTSSDPSKANASKDATTSTDTNTSAVAANPPISDEAKQQAAALNASGTPAPKSTPSPEATGNSSGSQSMANRGVDNMGNQSRNTESNSKAPIAPNKPNNVASETKGIDFMANQGRNSASVKPDTPKPSEGSTGAPEGSGGSSGGEGGSGGGSGEGASGGQASSTPPESNAIAQPASTNSSTPTVGSDLQDVQSSGGEDTNSSTMSDDSAGSGSSTSDGGDSEGGDEGGGDGDSESMDSGDTNSSLTSSDSSDTGNLGGEDDSSDSNATAGEKETNSNSTSSSSDDESLGEMDSGSEDSSASAKADNTSTRDTSSSKAVPDSTETEKVTPAKKSGGGGDSDTKPIDKSTTNNNTTNHGSSGGDGKEDRSARINDSDLQIFAYQMFQA